MKKYKPIDNDTHSTVQFTNAGLIKVNGSSYGLPSPIDAGLIAILPFSTGTNKPVTNVNRLVNTIFTGLSKTNTNVYTFLLFNDYLVTGNKMFNFTYDPTNPNVLLLTTYLPTAALMDRRRLSSEHMMITGTTFGTTIAANPVPPPSNFMEGFAQFYRKFNKFLTKGICKSGVPAKRIMEEVYYSDMADLSSSVDIEETEVESEEEVLVCSEAEGDNRLTVFGQEVTIGVNNIIEVATSNLSAGDQIRLLVTATTIVSDINYESFIAPVLTIPAIDSEPVTHQYRIRFNTGLATEYIISVTISNEFLTIEASSDNIFIGIKSISKLS